MSAIPDHRVTPHRNVICCLLALEIAEYEAKPVFEQIRSTQDLRKLLLDATAHAGSDDVVSIVREDGALLAFLADPEDCFAAALAIRESTSAQDCYRDLPLRIGITLGTVEIAEDEFGHPYVSGEGRQDVDRVMRHGPPRQVSVARPFVELLSRAAPELSVLLEYEGVFSDTVCPPLCLYRLPPLQMSVSEGPQALRAAPKSSGMLVDASLHPDLVSQAVRAQTLANRRNWLRGMWLRYALFPLIVGALLLTAPSRILDLVPNLLPAAQLATDARELAPPAPVVAASAPASSEEITHPADAGLQGLPAAAPATPRPTILVDDRMSRTLPAKRHSEKRLPAGSKQVAIAGASARQKSKSAAEGATQTQAAEGRAGETEAATIQSPRAGRAATLVLAIKPWGEVYIDGKKIGITPPLKRFEVAPGRRQITVTNSGLPSYQREVTLDPEEQMTVAHDFDCVSHREKPCREGFGKGLELPSRFRLDTTEAGRS
jgi:PEGA domain-containing protein